MEQYNLYEINGILLAGGLSSRFGTCKSELRLHDKSILKKTFELLQKFCPQVYISCREEKKIEGYPCIYDNFICYAPMAGIYSALEFLKSPLIVLSCDLPFMDEKIIKKLIDERNKALESNKNLHMTSYRKEGTQFIESLVAIYEYESKNIFKKALEEGKFSLNKAIREENRHAIDYNEEEARAFFNINYPKDLEEAKKIFQVLP